MTVMESAQSVGDNGSVPVAAVAIREGEEEERADDLLLIFKDESPSFPHQEEERSSVDVRCGAVSSAEEKDGGGMEEVETERDKRVSKLFLLVCYRLPCTHRTTTSASYVCSLI